jgi:hypothetical protein
MYDSLKEHAPGFHLYIFAFDDLTYTILVELKLENTTIISLKEFENEDLLGIKSSRTRAEYCWTCTSSTIDYVFNTYNVQECTYLDADLFFYASPAILLNEIPENKSVLITEHRFSKFARIFEQKRAGRFCVQFITFNNTKGSRSILKRWAQQCIEWCFARYEDGKFGDQKYLDTWPDEYPDVHILEHPGGGVAPWNLRQYNFNRAESKIFGINRKTKTNFDIIFFHFHFVKILANGYADLGWNRLNKKNLDLLYLPYIRKIVDKEKLLEGLFPNYKQAFASVETNGLREKVKSMYKRVTHYNLVKIQLA